MSKSNIVVIIVAILIIIICFTVGSKKTKQETNQINNQNYNVTYNTVKDEITGEDKYVVYDKETGVEKTRVTEEYQLKIYETNPDYEELPVEENIEGIEESIN